MSRAAFTVLVTGLAALTASPAHADAMPTPKLLLELATGKRALGELIDPSRGLLFMDHFPTPGEDGNTMEDTHACGAKLDSLIKRRWPQVIDAIKSAKANGSLTCELSTLTCRAGGRGEWDPVFHFTFEAHKPDAQGQLMTLRAIAIDDEVLVGDDDVANEHARQARQIAKLTRCP